MTMNAKSTTTSKRNKRLKDRNRFVARCERRVVFNTYADDTGEVLSPKASLKLLQARRIDILSQMVSVKAKKSCDEEAAADEVDIEALSKERDVIEKEILICERFLEKEAKRAKRYRSTSGSDMSSSLLKRIKKDLSCLSQEDLEECRHIIMSRIEEVPNPPPNGGFADNFYSKTNGTVCNHDIVDKTTRYNNSNNDTSGRSDENTNAKKENVGTAPNCSAAQQNESDTWFGRIKKIMW